MNVYLFGATTTTGQAYVNIFKKNYDIKNLKAFSRYFQESLKLDLDKPDLFQRIATRMCMWTCGHHMVVTETT